MPEAKDVNPQKWTDKIDLFDDGEYSVCWGYYDMGEKKVIGKRWNESYPNLGGNPTWFVENPIFTKDTLLSIVNELCGKNRTSQEKEYLKNTLIALSDIKRH